MICVLRQFHACSVCVCALIVVCASFQFHLGRVGRFDFFVDFSDVGWWLDRADFYDPEWFPGITYFDSWEEMVELAKRVWFCIRFDLSEQVHAKCGVEPPHYYA